MSLFYESAPDTKDYHLLRYKLAAPAIPHFHAALELLLVKSGHIRASVNGECLDLRAGEGCFVNAFCVHSYAVLKEHTEIFVLVGNSALFSSAISDLGGVPPLRFTFEDHALLHHAVTLYESAKEEGVRLSLFKGTVTLLLSDIACREPFCPQGTCSASSDIVAVLRYISEHFTEPITLTSLAQRFGYAPTYLSRLFHAHIAINLTEYIAIARVNYAMQLLDAGKSVTDAAFGAGFGSMPSFYRAYKKHTRTFPKR